MCLCRHLVSALMLIILPHSFCLSLVGQNMMCFTLVVVLIADVEASTIQPFSDCSSGTASNNPSNVLNTLSTTYNPGFVLSSTYYSAQGVFATYYNVQPTGTADVRIEIPIDKNLLSTINKNAY